MKIPEISDNSQKDQFTKELEKCPILGEGSFGKVYCVETSQGKKFALKQIYEKTFEKISKVFIETQFHLLFPPSVPLIPLEDMYLEYAANEEKPFVLNILMEKAE